MTSGPSDENDQLARFGRELKEGSWYNNSRQRAQRRKSPWNFLLLLFGLPLWGLFTLLPVWAALSLHRIFHVDAAPLFASGPLRLNTALILFPALFAALSPALIVTNFLVYLIPSARRAMEAEDRGYQGVDYASSQRSLSKAGLWVLVVCIPLMLLGAFLA